MRRLQIYWRNLQDIVIGRIQDLGGVSQQGTIEQLSPPQGRLWCLYAAYSRSSVVSDMVLAQLAAYKSSGFSIVFVSMSENVAEEDRDKLANYCTHLIHRKSIGRDFGAWAHTANLLGDTLEDAEAVLFTNDSNLGPFYPLESWIKACRVREGFFGLTESIGGGSHLQSYFLLANGHAVVKDALRFLRTLKLTHSKWLMVQRGEIGFTQTMQRNGHYTGAILDHETLENALLENQELLAELFVMHPELREGLDPHWSTRNRYLLRSRLFLIPLNPNHKLNSVLLNHFHFPFVKVDLVTKNQGLVPSAPDWRYFLTSDSPVTEAMIDDHLAAL